MRLMNSTKSAVGPMNSSKNKLNSKISWQKYFLPNGHLLLEWVNPCWIYFLHLGQCLKWAQHVSHYNKAKCLPHYSSLFG